MSHVESPGAGPAQRHRLLVAVDFGTTYTETITTWPGSGGSVEKVPTEPAYVQGQNPKWGSEASGSHYSRGANGHPEVYGRFKLLLDPSVGRDVYGEFDDQRNDATSRIPLPASKTAIQLCTDYLKQLNKHVMEILRKRMPDTLDSTPIEFIFTVPAIWSHKAQEATRTAALRAGFGSGGRPIDTMSMISEPEAAAIYSLASLHEDKTSREKAGMKSTEMQPGEHFMVCDAGGGTVDLITYQVEQIFPDLKIRESVVGGGGKCGSTYIDDAFHNLLRARIGPSFDNNAIWTPKKKGKGSQLMQKFEICKRTFGQTGNDVWFLELPVPVKNNEDNGISDNELELTIDDMESLFNPIVTDIIKLVEIQARKVKNEPDRNANKGKLTTVILVGGFGESQYLYQKLQQWGNRQVPPLTIINPTKSWSAILTTDFDPEYHDEKEKRLCIWSGRFVIDDNVKWAAKLGDDCSEEKEISFNVFFDITAKANLKRDYELKLLGSRYFDPPRASSSDKVFSIGRVPLDFSDINLKKLSKKVVDGKSHFQNNCTVKMRIGSADASFSVWIGDKCYGSSRIAYND
ncbi:hypothetical protein ABW20_dc0105441 [Dactylellina cionopaga]|nr:hypothetical protein ABW20_dc0105441 [Dactylellina cionopaga]